MRGASTTGKISDRIDASIDIESTRKEAASAEPILDQKCLLHWILK